LKKLEREIRSAKARFLQDKRHAAKQQKVASGDSARPVRANGMRVTYAAAAELQSLPVQLPAPHRTRKRVTPFTVIDMNDLTGMSVFAHFYGSE